MIKLKFLPARFGDCIWIEYGDGEDRNRILIDGGTAGTRHDIKEMIESLPEEDRYFELMVVTHIDKDHIAGILGLLEENDLGFKVRDFWYNGFKHLTEVEEVVDENDEDFGAKQGEHLTQAILKHEISWNGDFNNKAVVVDSDILPKITLPGGMQLTLLSPTPVLLKDLKPKWVKEVTKANMVPGGPPIVEEEEEEDETFGEAIPDINALAQTSFHEDHSEANGSSIAFLATFNAKSILFCGDAFPSQLVKTLNIIEPDRKIDIDLMKVSHHASSHNTSPELLEKIKCSNYIISTNGSTFKHPKADTISRIIKTSGAGTQLLFNYKSSTNEIWGLNSLKNAHNYDAIYPETGIDGIEIVL
ncbi:ComEC/Rec2 family competence protein [Flavivirga jejuensis]|uniref:Metallo-beta-lactamase superfamily protein n=1 Tax=Flavivirga jejuensis TaxID=870487 RepID=A0ABT8WNG7_9FLAO|nr:hypothetical protein [Flavivirga jejuensis]MDO5974529.1 hypothetical protein [Flavivirga jejuensis]